MLGRGWSNAEIAGTLQMSRNTIKTHIRMAYRKIGAKDRAEAIAWALTHQPHHESAT
jgi:DNA-binding CsgD family transcriptional regulator